MPDFTPPVLDGPSFNPTILKDTARATDAEFVNALVDQFFTSLEERLQQMHLALQKHDGTQLQMVLHTLKGMSAQVGAAHVHQFAKTLEDQMRQGATIEIIAPHIPALETHIKEVRQYIKLFLQDLANGVE